MIECIECGAPATEFHHCIYGRGRRQLADEDGLIVPMCRCCHGILHSSYGVEMAKRYRRFGETIYLLKGHSVEEFVARYGKNYL